MDTGYIVVLITASSAEEAQKIAAALLERKKAACVNIISGLDSRFWWHGKLDSAQECLLIVKSSARLLPDIIALVRATHSYTVPEVIALPITGGNPDYLNWIDESVA